MNATNNAPSRVYQEVKRHELNLPLINLAGPGIPLVVAFCSGQTTYSYLDKKSIRADRAKEVLLT